MPGFLERFRRRRFERQFAGHTEGGFGGNLYRGVFASFEEAQSSAPPSKPVGYDNPAAAELYLERTRRIYPSDYPVVYWLDRLFRGDKTRNGLRSVFDFGGHIGLGYYAYRKYVTYPEQMRWTVHDVPAVMAKGQELAVTMDPEKRLGFAQSVAAADGHDIFFSAGALQYLPTTLAEMLAPLKNKPRALLLNLAPLHPSESFYTLQSLGLATAPYRVLQFGAFVKILTQLGYVQRDAWENPDKRCTIAFEPNYSIDRYYGFLFELP